MIKKQSLKSLKTIVVEWGDCDPAQIVYFPRYFVFFDACTTALFKKAGLPKQTAIKKYGIIGIPMVAVQASFRSPSRFSDEVEVISEIMEFRRSSFFVRHQLFNKGILSVECLETRVWASISAKNPEKIESTPIPQEVIARFSRPSQPAKASRKRGAGRK